MTQRKRRKPVAMKDHVARPLHSKSKAFLRASEDLVRVRRVLRDLQGHQPGVHVLVILDVVRYLALLEAGLVSELSDAIRGIRE